MINKNASSIYIYTHETECSIGNVEEKRDSGIPLWLLPMGFLWVECSTRLRCRGREWGRLTMNEKVEATRVEVKENGDART